MKLLEEAIENMDLRVDYSTVNLRLVEERPLFADVEFVEFKDLSKSFVDSLNSLITLLFVIVPWLIALIILRIVYKLTKK